MTDSWQAFFASSPYSDWLCPLFSMYSGILPDGETSQQQCCADSLPVKWSVSECMALGLHIHFIPVYCDAELGHNFTFYPLLTVTPDFRFYCVTSQKIYHIIVVETG
jgi:hypothetical protein